MNRVWRLRPGIFLVLIPFILFSFGCNGPTSNSNSNSESKITAFDPSTLPPNKTLPAVPKGALSKAVFKQQNNEIESLIKAGADINENIGTSDLPLTPLLLSILNADAA